MTRKFKRRELILAQASQLFMEKGFAATSLEDIAEAVGIRRESLYYYYPGKYDLLYDIIEPQIAKVMTGFEKVIGQDTDIRTTIERGIENHLNYFNADYLHMAMAVRKNSRDEVEQKFAHLRRLFKNYENLWLILLTTAQKERHLQGHIPPKMLAYSILGLCNSLSSWYMPDGEMSLDQIARHYSRIILDGIAPA
ncbi:hypothetical protein MNBD_ALPHA02-1585 [hydrothermal vent metagenome]|uniref:HTH tetR-type domain-containing protein n=1 Tax=hydrothermal vent metagenome TaxID=652676 RepID=A0A3B0RQR7_9ZZZZ